MNKLALALGTFDGLHRGHLNVLNEAKAFALDGFVPAMLMFDTHPQAVLKGFAPPLLITMEDKKNLAKEIGVLPIHISFEEIRNLSPEEFLCDILIHPRADAHPGSRPPCHGRAPAPSPQGCLQADHARKSGHAEKAVLHRRPCYSAGLLRHGRDDGFSLQYLRAR